MTEEEVYCNNSDLPIPVEYTSESEKGHTSLFMPVGMPDGEVAACEVPVPLAVRDGTPRVSIVMETPFGPYYVRSTRISTEAPDHWLIRRFSVRSNLSAYEMRISISNGLLLSMSLPEGNVCGTM